MLSRELSFNKTRIAPTPSGYLHIGNALSFIITSVLATRSGAKVLLRIDDLDRDRVFPEYVQDIFDTLNFMQIPWNEGPRNYEEYANKYSQVHRMALYSAALDYLMETGNVFGCVCSRADVRHSKDGNYAGTCLHKNISLDAENVTWRLQTGNNKSITVKNLDGTRTTTTLPPFMQYFVVRKRNGMPAYQLSSVVDDIHFGVDLIVRGEDLMESTLAQLYLSSLLPANTFAETIFYHHPLLMDNTSEKLSKSAGATSIQHMRKEHLALADLYNIIGGMLRPGGTAHTQEELVALLHL